MKTLYLVRHAKSSWDDPSLDDYDRPLNNRGRRDAPFMGDKLKAQGIKPDLIYASPAKRAEKTAKLIAEQTGYPKESIEFKKKIYMASERVLLAMVRSVPKKVGSLMLIGHNPELTAFSNMLTGGSILNIPTTGISCIRFDVRHWEDIKEFEGISVFFDYPKRYVNQDPM